MFKHFSIQQKLIILVTSISVLSMFFFLSRELYRSYLLNDQIANFEKQNKQIQEKTEDMKDLVEYYESERYQDKYAKESLNKLNPGEKVLIIPQNTTNLMMPESDLLSEPQTQSPFESWKEFFFGPPSVENRKVEINDY